MVDNFGDIEHVEGIRKGTDMGGICETCGQQIQECPPKPLNLIDQLYLAFGRCCAGCDFWEHDTGRTRPMGYCHKQPIDECIGFDMEFPGGVKRYMRFATTDAKHVCPKFQDTFDWSLLGINNPPWLSGQPELNPDP